MFPLAHRISGFGTSIFSEMNRLAAEYNAINLAQGFPDFSGPSAVIETAKAALRAGQNQYSPMPGLPVLRQAVAAHAQRFYQQAVEAESNITITAGALEALYCSFAAFLNPGDEVVVFEPFFDCYLAHAQMMGAVVRFVPLRPTASGEWGFDESELRAAFNNHTRLLVLNTPHNPTGKVFTRAEMELIAELCQQWNVIAVTDEVYEHIVYNGAQHLRLATFPGMEERTITISTQGKMFNFTGWRVGWAIAPPLLTAGLRRVHQFTTFCAPTPLQAATAKALALDDEYFESLAADFRHKRDFLAPTVQKLGFQVSVPNATYFLMADFSALGFDGDDVALCRWLAREAGVVLVPASAMYSEEHRALGQHWVRFAYCKTMETLEQAVERLRKMF
ncbi:MAG: aminotransferase class I/II-fold pyridoxal phosphate-dependent enzyme [Anaerolineales bacterium]|nr:aminotransferase class I/II-fold pyridoxal phosphate-dependent enzyme [Anaerolineales bacterium]